jgi:hypothetical protein
MPDLDIQAIIQSMVRALHRRPAKWLTFSFLAQVIGKDIDLLGGIADSRPDIFAVSQDRRLKLRQSVVEQIAVQGIVNWRIPEIPEPRSSSGSYSRAIPGQGLAGAGCYCQLTDETILDDLKRGSPPEDALVRTCCWKRICQVRGRYFNHVEAETWQEICSYRGYLRARENPAGF